MIQGVKLDQKYFALVDKFLNCYKANVKHSLAKITAKNLGFEEPLDKLGLDYLLKKHYITRVLVGMRKQEYVDRVIEYTKES